jgi:hypothetical protein
MAVSAFLDQFPIWVIYLGTIALALICTEIGYQVGTRLQRRTQSTKDPSLGALVGASLGLLAFLLAFLTGVAADRFDNRRRLVVQDANAIGTAELRARYLPEPHRTQDKALYREYVDQRLKATLPGALAAARARSEEIQGELWQDVTELVASGHDTDVFAAYIEALNNLIDVHGERVAAVNARVPGTLFGIIYLVALLSVALVGFNNSFEGRRGGPALFVFILIFAGVISLIVDLDRPQDGLLVVSQQPMIDLQTQLHSQ